MRKIVFIACVGLAISHLSLSQDANKSGSLKFNNGQATGKNGYGCAIGDLNNDGYPDIFIANADLGFDQVWFNDGKGGFVNTGVNIGSTVKRDRSIALADLNGDGYLDVFIANDQIGNDVGCPNEVWFNDGTGKLIDSGQRLGNLASTEVSLGDMDGDEDFDAVVANLHDLQGNDQPNELWLNDGKGNFTKHKIDLGKRSYSLILADVNNDNKKDIVFDCTIWINKGNAEFAKSSQTFGNGRRLYFGDFDRDGDQDAFVLKGGPSGDVPNEIWNNDGTGKFTDSGQRLGNSCGHTAAIGDIDGDGDLDIYAANGFFNKVEADVIWLNQGNKQGGTPGMFVASEVVFPATRSWEVRLADLNKDKKMDILVTNGWGRDEENIVYLNSGNAQLSFTSNGQNIASSNAWDIHLVDLNGDSVPDAYFEERVWLNDGEGHFTKTKTAIGTGTYSNFADLNGDGYVDVVCKDSIFLNDGTFHFSFSKKLDSDIEMHRPLLADIDNDGDIDIISCSATTDGILLNDGKGNFTNTGKSLGGWGQASYAFGDINRDGYTDIYVAIPHVPPMGGHTPDLIWLGDSTGNFTQKPHDIPGAQSRGAILADFDLDGDLDLYVSDAASWGRIFFNSDGKGNFDDSSQKLGSHSGPVKTADFNKDGYLDLFICQGGENGLFGNGAPSTVWLGDGHGHFTDSIIRLHSGNSNSIAVDVGDINGDGKPDAVVANIRLTETGSPVISPIEIWLNNSPCTALTAFSCNYLNEPKPGNIPVIFGKGIVSVEGENTHACTFSPDGNMLIFSRYPEKKSYMMIFNYDQWAKPTEAFFEGKETSFSADGGKVFYYKNGGDIYFNEKTASGWGNSISVGNVINTSETEYYPSVTDDGTLFFSRNGKWTEGRIMYSTFSKGKYDTPVDIGLPVNTGGALHAYVAPDKSYMLFNSPRTGSHTKLDIWISFHKADRSWTDPQNLGETINSGADAILCPTVTPDGKYMFFTKLTFGTNTGNVYWVSTSFIDALKTR